MKADYLTLIDGRTVRILWNMNALGEFYKLTGKELTDLIGGKSDINTLRTIAWCSAMEGENADGKELELTEKEFGRLMSMSNITRFSEILTAHITGVGQKKSPEKGKAPRVIVRGKQ